MQRCYYVLGGFCRFEGLSGVVQFDERGDADGRYQIDQLQKIGEQYVVKTVGFWYKSTMSLELTEDLYWNVAHSEGAVPESLCSKPCAPGQYYVQLELRWVPRATNICFQIKRKRFGLFSIFRSLFGLGKL